MSQYIPDLTERFPEGFGGVDLTDSYFYEPRRSNDPWEMLDYLESADFDDREDCYEDRNYNRLYDDSEEDDAYEEEPKDMEKFYENWGDQIDEDELPFI